MASDDPVEPSEGAAEATEQEEGAASQSTPPKWTEDWLPAAVGDALSPLLAKYGALFDDQWRLTTVLVWSIWTSVSLAYTVSTSSPQESSTCVESSSYLTLP